MNERSSIHSDANLNFHVNNISGPPYIDSYLQLEEASFDVEFSMERAQKEDSHEVDIYDLRKHRRKTLA